MMMTVKLSKFLLLILGFASLAGFSETKRYIELDSYLNGRSSASFHTSSNNIEMLLPKGTRGEVLKAQKLPSGNFGFYILIHNGINKGEKAWIYYDQKNRNLELFENPPATWNATTPKKTARIDDAKGLETTTQTRARSTEDRHTENLLGVIADSNNRVQNLRSGLCTSNCEGRRIPEEQVPILRPTTRAMARACTNLMNGNGELGENGQVLMSVMSEPQYSIHLLKSNALGSFCPNFNSLSDSQKLKAWAWFWTSLAMEESSCQANKEHPTTYVDRQGNTRILNPREGFGYWALERDRNVRRWRGEACSNIGTPSNQARCSIDIMINTQLARGLSAGINSVSYWGPVRRGQSQILPHMRRFSLCFQN